MRIGVIGTGITGMAAAWLLHRDHEITVFEQNGYVGGHSNTVDAPGADGAPIAVDTGFIVYNEVTYPNLVRLFDHLSVPNQPSDMSFAVSIDGGRLEYSGSNLAALFAQRRNLLRPAHYAMLRDILRFYREAPKLLESGESDLTLGDYLSAGGYGHGFVYDHLLPMGAAIWSASMQEIMAFPARSFVRFFHNHGLMKVADRPQWRTVSGGSRQYVKRLTAGFADRIHPGRAAVSVRRDPAGVTVIDATGERQRFDQVIIAAHADQALGMLDDAAPDERHVLGAFRYTKNRAVLHSDPALMPRRKRAWAAWNYLSSSAGDNDVSVTYWMNALQGIDPAHPLFVSLNPLAEPAADRTYRSFVYDHPVFDGAAVAMQPEIGGIQGIRRTWFCGAYCGYGFHEDGLSAGLAVAEALGAQRPWRCEDASPAGRNVRPVEIERLAAAE